MLISIRCIICRSLCRFTPNTITNVSKQPNRYRRTQFILYMWLHIWRWRQKWETDANGDTRLVYCIIYKYSLFSFKINTIVRCLVVYLLLLLKVELKFKDTILISLHPSDYIFVLCPWHIYSEVHLRNTIALWFKIERDLHL